MSKQHDATLGAWSTADLGAFFVEFRTEFLSHARRLTANPAEAEEIVQDSLVRVLLASPELHSPEHARAYFHRVIENLGVDLQRRLGRQPQLLVLDDVTAELESQWRGQQDHADSLAAADDAALVREAISLLSPAERAALIMWEFEGRSTAEIARELGVRETAVRHTLSRARSGLRRLLAERIIDNERNLTALDLLSVSFRKMETISQKASRSALSLLLILAVFLGFRSLAAGEVQSSEIRYASKDQSPGFDLRSEVESQEDGEDSLLERSDEQVKALGENDNSKSMSESMMVRSSAPIFPGLDSEGVPTDFTVVNQEGLVGQLFVGDQKSSLTETGLLLTNLISTRSGSTNILVDQSIVLDAMGTSYVAEVSVGINGGWHPLLLSYISSDVERLASGNYLLTAFMMVDSAVEPIVMLPTGKSGIDLDRAPQFVATRVLLNPAKTQILAQAVLVSADSQGDEA